MNANRYQGLSAMTAIYPGHGEGTMEGLVYLSLKLSGEAGEVAEKVGKAIRDMQRGMGDTLKDMPAEWIVGLRKELGDVLWYVSQIATELDAELPAIMEENLNKLNDRKRRGTISGSGDNR